MKLKAQGSKLKGWMGTVNSVRSPEKVVQAADRAENKDMKQELHVLWVPKQSSESSLTWEPA